MYSPVTSSIRPSRLDVLRQQLLQNIDSIGEGHGVRVLRPGEHRLEGPGRDPDTIGQLVPSSLKKSNILEPPDTPEVSRTNHRHEVPLAGQGLPGAVLNLLSSR